jgi:hypothetical protein
MEDGDSVEERLRACPCAVPVRVGVGITEGDFVEFDFPRVGVGEFV